MPLSPEQVETVYADAVAAFRDEHDPTFAQPDLRYADLPDDDGVRYDDHGHAVRVDTTAVGGMAALEDAFTDRFEQAYATVVEESVAAIADDLDASYPFLDTRRYDHTVSFTDLDGDYRMAVNPSKPSLILDERERSHIDTGEGGVTDVLRGRMRQQLAHIAVHRDGLYDEPGLLPYWFYVESDTPVMNEHGARHAFEAAVDTFQGGYDEGFDPPDLVIADGPYDWDREEGVITLDARILSELNHEFLKDDFLLTFKTFYDEALHDGLDHAIDWLETLHGLDGDIEIEEAFFKDLGDGTSANYNRSNKRVRIHEKYMDRFDIETGRFEITKPDSSRVHEVEHGRDYQLHPHTGTWKSNRSSTKEVYGEDRDFKEDIRNATLEMKTTFVQWLYGRTSGRQAAHRAIEDPWHMPDFFDGYLDLYGPRDTDTIRDPYRFGLFTARSLLRGLVNEHGPDEGLDLTLDYLRSVTTTPEGIQGTLERSLDKRSVPNYPRTLDRFYRAIRATEPDDAGITTFARRFDEQLETAASRDEHLDPYLQARALLDGFEAAHPDAAVPDPLDALQERVDAVKDEYVDEELDAGDHPEWLENVLEKRFS